MILEQAKKADIIITTALIPGKPAPKLIYEEAVKTMKPGSVIVDMAAEMVFINLYFSREAIVY